MKNSSKIIWGIVLVVAGIIFALNAFGLTDIDVFFDGWWTLFIIIPCAVGIFTTREKLGNAIGVAVGVVLLLWRQGLVEISLIWKLMVPAAIVLVGLKLIFGTIKKDKGEKTFKKIEQKNGNVRSCAAVFSGAKLDFCGEEFNGAQLDAVFGGVECDLRGAVITEDCAINASAVFGGVDIFLPIGVNVKVVSSSIFGGVSGKDRKANVENAPTLYINANCIFGGVELK